MKEEYHSCPDSPRRRQTLNSVKVRGSNGAFTLSPELNQTAVVPHWQRGRWGKRVTIYYHFCVAVWRGKTAESRYVKYCGTLILVVLFASLARSEDFKTTNGKVYKDATVSRIEADGIELKTKTGISKVYFTELPQDVQERFHWAKPEAPREPFYSRWAVAAEDPAVLAKIIAFGASIIASVGLVIRHIRSRRQQTMLARHTSRRKALHRTRS
ncbi:MAG: hypothetical protein WA849_13740 [Candidatus Udaeobacter sp.]